MVTETAIKESSYSSPEGSNTNKRLVTCKYRIWAQILDRVIHTNKNKVGRVMAKIRNVERKS